MAGTLTATVGTAQSSTAALASTGALTAAASERYAAAATALAASGALDIASIRQQGTASASPSASGALTALLKPVYALFASMFGGSMLSATATSAGFTDNFNRPDSSNLGPGWLVPPSPFNVADNFAISSGMAVTTGGTNNNYAQFAATVPSDNYRIDVTMGTSSAAFDYIIIVCRMNAAGTHYVRTRIARTLPVDIGVNGFQAASPNKAQDIAWVPGDVLSVHALGNLYIVKKNGQPIFGWQDVTGQVPIDANHRLTVLGATTFSGPHAIDTFGVYPDDTPELWLYGDGTLSATAAKGFRPSRVTKNAAQTWATSATWVDITPWLPVNDGTYFSSIADSGVSLVVNGSKTAATLAASVPFTGSTSTRTHTVRIIRSSDSAVIVTGSGVAAASGTCTASTTANVVDGERYKVQMNSDGTSAGTVTASTPTLTIS